MYNTIMKKLSKRISYLYHGSPVAGLKVLMPKPSGVLNGESAVFATPYRSVAISFLQPWSDDDFEQGCVNGQFYMKEQYFGAFNKIFKNKIGTIYTVSSLGFESDPRLARYERVSYNPRDVIKEEEIADALSALRQTEFSLFNFGQILPWENKYV